MADALVELLNSLGYQPVFLPQTGIVPPELYNYARGRLIRRGPLQDYAQEASQLEPKRGVLADISHKQSSGKKMRAAVSFLDRALKCLGIATIPKLDLSFASGSDVMFSFADVTYRSVDPSRIDHILGGIELGAIPEDYADDQLHIAYEYAYARRLTMSRVDSRALDFDASFGIGDYIDLGPQGVVKLESASTISFTSHMASNAAFAYKAGRLERGATRWEFYPEEVTRSLGQSPEPFLLEPGAVLSAVK